MNVAPTLALNSSNDFVSLRVKDKLQLHKVLICSSLENDDPILVTCFHLPNFSEIQVGQVINVTTSLRPILDAAVVEIL